MTWVRLDDKFADHPKVLGLSNSAFRLHVTAICYSASQLTDGFISDGVLGRLGWASEDGIEDMQELVKGGLWELQEKGYQIHDYLEYNPTGEDVKAEREKAKDRMRTVRANQQRNDNGTFGRSSGEVRANNRRSSSNVTPSPIPIPSIHTSIERQTDTDPGVVGQSDPYRLIAATWEQRMGQTITYSMSQSIREAMRTYGVVTICEAIEKAAEKGNPRWAYVSGILANWQNEGRRNGGPPKPKDGRSPLTENDPNATTVTVDSYIL